ncbi:N-terminal Xaa-Pro-Lys N-methyltransferase 1 [Microplitis demolitor]|uniref:N-terminal Xaa-Pro-Lys N-methyltransferase 1 n=1 Tax=Microplitis demolitor TaxID=69319 RepID=UPI0004CC9915|nr:N-terminal Xaa-Pro-Lys N-methyltransferase 1 [Microplitis demolitor]
MEDISKSSYDPKEFYADSAKYWNNVPATLNGMLGGFGFISRIDIDGSDGFLNSLFELENPPNKNYALDCGSGIGRITKKLLIKHFKLVDLVEQNSKFLDTAKKLLQSSNVGEFYSLGLQDFYPESKKYDVIWCQWVLGYLHDDDLIEFLKKCSNALKNNGMIIVKENLTSSNKIEVDVQDSSFTRPYDNLKKVFQAANLICIKEQEQLHLPQGLYPVHMFALRPGK